MFKSPRMVYFREKDSPFVYHFVFFEHGGENKNKGRKEGGRMRIDSSTIGMDSTRKYTSVSGRVAKLMISSGRQSLMGGTGALFGNALGADVEGSGKQMGEKENPEDALLSTFEEMKSKVRPITSESTQGTGISNVREQLMEIRQQCINYLMDILFPGKMGRRDWVNEVMSSSSLYTSSSGGTKTFSLSNQSYFAEAEETSFSTQGTVKCADGREINFNLNLEMTRSFQEYYEVKSSITQAPLCDPLVINLNGNIPELSDQTFKFDIDGDGQEDEINRLGPGSGFIALDKNGDGIINDGAELFGAKSGNGFADLAAYDEDHNGFIDEGDAIWDKLKIWVMDENGNQQLYSLAEKGVGAICLQNVSTNYSITDEDNRTKGVIRNTGVFLYENGNVGTVSHVDMALHEQKRQENIKRKQSKYAQWMYAMAN